MHRKPKHSPRLCRMLLLPIYLLPSLFFSAFHCFTCFQFNLAFKLRFSRVINYSSFQVLFSRLAAHKRIFDCVSLLLLCSFHSLLFLFPCLSFCVMCVRLCSLLPSIIFIILILPSPGLSQRICKAWMQTSQTVTLSFPCPQLWKLPAHVTLDASPLACVLISSEEPSTCLVVTRAAPQERPIESPMPSLSSCTYPWPEFLFISALRLNRFASLGVCPPPSSSPSRVLFLLVP